ncbi:MAG TPA: phosphatase PAP2 family protein [Bacillota bacterium]|nr:phosphatase PAP2 family protein [Bacillota bacterium]
MMYSQKSRMVCAFTAAVMIFLTDFAAFFIPKLFIEGASFHDLSIPLDAYVPFVPEFIYIYILSYFFWFVTPFFCVRSEPDRFFRWLSANIISLLICSVFFLALPATLERPDVIPDSLTTWLVEFIYECDTPTNLLPSIHCLLSWFCFIGVRSQKKIPLWYRIFSLVFALLVCASTVLVRQHTLADIFSALALAELVWFVSKHTKLHLLLMRLFKKLSVRFE